MLIILTACGFAIFLGGIGIFSGLPDKIRGFMGCLSVM